MCDLNFAWRVQTKRLTFTLTSEYFEYKCEIFSLDFTLKIFVRLPAEFLVCSWCNKLKTRRCSRRHTSQGSLHSLTWFTLFNTLQIISLKEEASPGSQRDQEPLHPSPASPTEIKQPLWMKSCHVKGVQEGPGGGIPAQWKLC